MQWNLTERELYQRGGGIDELLECSFDASVLIDRNYRILYASRGFCTLWKHPKESVLGQLVEGSAIGITKQVIETGRAQENIPWIINGHRGCASQIPIVFNHQVIGILGTLKLLKPSLVKSVFSLPETTAGTYGRERSERGTRTTSWYTFKDYWGSSPSVLQVLTICKRAALTPYPILLLGETGTGKELISHSIHAASNFEPDAPFIRINCTAIPNELLESELFGHEKGAFSGSIETKIGKFELASGGTLLLDEIGDMDLRLQGKLLRVLEEKEFERVGGNRLIPLSARVIASTNCDLHQKCRDGTFRQDLFYRLSALEVRLPPLRERPEDIPLLIESFLDKLQYHFKLDSKALEMLCAYSWPGNVRQLKNLLTRLRIQLDRDVITAEDLVPFLSDSPVTIRESQGFQSSTQLKVLEYSERERIESILKSCKWNITAASKILGITRTTLYNKIRKYQISEMRMG